MVNWCAIHFQKTRTQNQVKVAQFSKKESLSELENRARGFRGNFKHYKVGESPGAVNLLNMPDPYWNPATWFEDYNKDWMLPAIQRGDDIYIASPINNGTLYNDYGGSYFAQELNELINAGLKPKNIDLNTWNSLKLDIITAAGTKY